MFLVCEVESIKQNCQVATRVACTNVMGGTPTALKLLAIMSTGQPHTACAMAPVQRFANKATLHQVWGHSKMHER